MTTAALLCTFETDVLRFGTRCEAYLAYAAAAGVTQDDATAILQPLLSSRLDTDRAFAQARDAVIAKAYPA